jgi:hypothetical protein
VPAAASDSAAPVAGPIPFDRHKAILEEARTKARQSAEAELRQKYGWADQYQNPQEVADAVKLLRWMGNDPEGFEAEWTKQRHGATPRPIEPALKADDGTPAYSASQVQELLTQQLAAVKAELEQQYGPVRAKVEESELRQRATAVSDQLIAEAKTWPQYEALRPEMAALMIANSALTLHQAYIQALSTKGVALIEEQVRARQQASLADKTAATTTRPGPQPTTPVDYRHMEARDITAAVWKDYESRR